MASIRNHETKFLRKSRLGPPDVYPQEVKQKEDELTSVNVKQGFINPPPFSNEYHSAHQFNIDSNKISISFGNIANHKFKINTIQDAGKKRPQVTKEHFCQVPVHNQKTRHHLQSWFSDLAGSKSLSALCRKVPVLTRKEDIFHTLAEYEVPLIRATWFIKMTAAYHLTQTDAKLKKRTAPDPNTDWTQAICKFMREQLSKLNTGNQVPGGSSSSRSSSPYPLTTSAFSTSASDSIGPISTIIHVQKLLTRGDIEQILKYTSNLACHMYSESLFDRNDFLMWVVEEFESIQMFDFIALNYFLPFILQYIKEIVMNQLLARRLCFAAARHLSWIFVDCSTNSRSQSPAARPGCPTDQPTALQQQLPSQAERETTAMQNQLRQRCPPFLQNVAHTLACAIQCTVIRCPGALVWYPPDDSKQCGSPLDLLPCAPSLLLLPDVPAENKEACDADTAARDLLRAREIEIIKRSRATESRWSSNKYQESSAGYMINRILGALDALDKQSFRGERDRGEKDRGDPLESLYRKLFDLSSGKDLADLQTTKSSEEAVISLLCEWAISPKRLGEHRAAVVAKLLDMRQAHYEKAIQLAMSPPTPASAPSSVDNPTKQASMSNEHQEEGTSEVSGAVNSSNAPYFQQILYRFLDTQAPQLTDPQDNEQVQSFKNLVRLYSELIEHDVFSHNHYLNTLVTKGEILPGDIVSPPTYTFFTSQATPGMSAVTADQSAPIGSNHSFTTTVASSLGGQLVEKGVEDLAALGEPCELDMDLFGQDPRGDRHFLDAVRSTVDAGGEFGKSKRNLPVDGDHLRPYTIWGYEQPKHAQYVMHFPIPFDEENVTQQWNQRLMILYGAGRRKSEVKRAVRKISRHLIKLVQCKRELLEERVDMKMPSAMAASMPSSGGASACGKPATRRSSKSPTHSELVDRFRRLSYFDQHMVTSNASKALISALDSYTSGRTSSLPRLDVVVLLFDLTEESLNIGTMLQTAVSLSTRLTLLAKEIKRNDADSVAGLSMTSPSTVSTNYGYGKTWYAMELALIVVAVIRHYQIYLTLNSDMALDAFKGFLELAISTSCISSPSQCSSPERSMLAFLYELYFSLPYVKLQFFDTFSPYLAGLKQALNSTKVKPATSNCRYETNFLREYIENPQAESPLSVAEKFSDQLRDVTFRYSFVCTVITTICTLDHDFEKANALSTLCAEMNARCNELGSEWLGVLKALCCSASTANFNDVLMRVGASDSKIRDPLALFTAVLIARGCLSLEDVIMHVAIPSLLAACNRPAQGLQTNPDTGARLTCHLLLQLFKSPAVGSHDNLLLSEKDNFRLPSSSDRHLLAVEQHNIAHGAVLAVLKGMLKLGDAGLSSESSSYTHDNEVSVTSLLAPIDDDMEDFDEMTGLGSATAASSGQIGEKKHDVASMESASLSDFAKHAVRVICSQQWVRERCLKDPDMELLMDHVLTRDQRQNLIQLICYPEEDFQRLSELNGNPREYVVSVLSEMTRWSLRQCLLELQVMLCESPQERSLPEYIAKATIEVFQRQHMQHRDVESRDSSSSWLSGPQLDKCNVWLVAPLVSKLPSQVQGKVLQEASTILETPQNWSTIAPSASSTTRSGVARTEHREYNARVSVDGGGGSSLLNNQAFLTLILTCLKGQDEQRDSLLESLQSQIMMLLTEWQSARSLRDAGKTDAGPYPGGCQNGVHEALQLRLSLVGGMFDTVQTNSQWTSDVVVLLTRLVSSGLVDMQINTDLFNTVFDMIAMLLHHTLGGDSATRGEGSKREYTNIVKKLKKEMGERQTDSLRRLRQLLPIPRAEIFVVCCEPIGAAADSKAIKFPTTQVDNNQGLQVTSKQKLNTWEVIEGLKHPAPLCLSWFAARRTERKVPYYEQQYALLRHHDHGAKRSLSDYLEPPDLPPEEEEIEIAPPPAKIPISRKSSTHMHQNKSLMPGGPGGMTELRMDDGPKKIKKPKKPKPRNRGPPELVPNAPRHITPSMGNMGNMMIGQQQIPPPGGSFAPFNPAVGQAPSYNPYSQQHVPPPQRGLVTNQANMAGQIAHSSYLPQQQQQQPPTQQQQPNKETIRAIKEVINRRQPAKPRTNPMPSMPPTCQAIYARSKPGLIARSQQNVSSYGSINSRQGLQPQQQHSGMMSSGYSGFQGQAQPSSAAMHQRIPTGQGYMYRQGAQPASYQPQTANMQMASQQQPSYMNQPVSSSYGMTSSMHQLSNQQAAYGSQQQTNTLGIVGMQPQQQPGQQYSTNRGSAISRIVQQPSQQQPQQVMSGGGFHQMGNASGHMPAQTNQRNIMGQHQQMIGNHAQQQYSQQQQPMSSSQQQQSMMNMRTNLHQQQPPPY